ncbi:hypothetical protein [Streptomyces sp. 8L]|uniref:hypothetical protein n=1 Tax=Streptomyces sp. 8L TaxID=2877242 RepID=UPI001CD516F2|nr:hypothetical protein [Streptomyces sp. 8L]MCA1218480.1 hypothetical protein [Streptomyces sp. 8L]
MQATMIARTRTPHAAAEPEPRHDRPTTPDPTPTPAPHPHAAVAALTPEQRLHREVRHRVCTADARISAEQRVLRTLAEMVPGFEREPLLTLHRPVMDAGCAVCGGAGGWSETTTTSDGAQITVWRSCHAC